jgi:GNAT superfamily N-acetyltransferase/AcrR family transcriptional regulator
MERVAAESGVAKTTIYRRWPTKAALCTELYLEVAGRELHDPATGDIASDLRHICNTVVRLQTQTVAGPAFIGLIAEALLNPKSSASFLAEFAKRRRELTHRVLERAIQRGQIRAETDVDLVIDALGGATTFRLLQRHAPLSRKFADALVTLVLSGCITPQTGRARQEIRPCSEGEVPFIEAIINEAAWAYEGVIPADCWHRPYMPLADLMKEIAAGVQFWGWYDSGVMIGVMGVQKVGSATLIRHAYVLSAHQGRGIGSALLAALVRQSSGQLLVGTWAAAEWAIRFYQRHGFRLVPTEEKDQLISSYWKITHRQRETSVVLVYTGHADNLCRTDLPSGERHG